MKLKVPYFKQTTDYTCGPASLEMVLDFLGKFKSERNLSREVGANPIYGTSHEHIISAAKKEGFNCKEHHGATITNLKDSIRQGLPVIVNYIEPIDNVGHYSVVIGFERGQIIMNDPADGRGFKLTEQEFLRRWHGSHDKKWMLVVSKEK